MSSGSASRSGAKPSAGPPAPAIPPRPSTNGSSMSPRNWPPSWNAPCRAPVAASPESCESALREIAAGEAEHAHETGRQRAAVVEEVVERVGDVLLVLIERRRPSPSARREVRGSRRSSV